MARNSEKAQSMLFRFRAAQAADLGIIDAGRTRRPRAITTITSIPLCEKWRGQVLKEISRKVSKIQESSLSDFQIRDLNDEINKLMREKHVWEVQIRSLGGPNYMRGGRVVDDEGREIPGGGRGYRYFGRARELPGVREMFEGKKGGGEKKDGGEGKVDFLRMKVDAEYFGYGADDEEEVLVEYERRKEEEAREALLARGEGDGGGAGGGQGGEGAGYTGGGKDWEPLPGDKGDGIGWVVPSADEVQEELVERRRRRLLDQLG